MAPTTSERSGPQPSVPDWPQFLRGRVRYRQSLDEQLPHAPRISVEFPTPDPQLTALRCNEAINAQELEGLVALMTEDHRFVDSATQETRGRDYVRRAWEGFFAAFADYRNDIATVSSRDDVVVMLGRSRCAKK